MVGTYWTLACDMLDDLASDVLRSAMGKTHDLRSDL